MEHGRESRPGGRRSRRWLLAGTGAVLGLGGLGYLMRRRIRALLSGWTRLDSFTRAPPLLPHDPDKDRRTLYVSRGRSPAENIDSVVDKLGGIERLVGRDDVVLVKVNAQWWNQGMTNVAAVRRLVERILARDGFSGEVIVFENVHFRLETGSGLARAWTHPSERNVDVPGWTRLCDLTTDPELPRAKVSFVGLVDAAASELAVDDWLDPAHTHGVYGGDGRGPIEDGEVRDGYCWSLEEAFEVPRSRVDSARTPLSWPVLVSPSSGLFIDLRRGVLRRVGDRLVPASRRLTWIVMSGANEHTATGITGACKSLMGVVDLSAGRFGMSPVSQEYDNVHMFGAPDAMWRMAGPLAHFTRRVRAPDLYIAVAEWTGALPPEPREPDADPRLSAEAAHHTRTVIAGADPVAVDAWCARNLLMPVAGARRHLYDMDDESSTITAFLRCWRETAGTGTLDPGLVEVA